MELHLQKYRYAHNEYLVYDCNREPFIVENEEVRVMCSANFGIDVKNMLVGPVIHKGKLAVLTYNPDGTLSEADECIIPYSKVLGEEIVEYGKLFIGTPYVWGGNDIRNGVDCSGLTKKVFEGFDINISRLSYTQVNDGRKVSKSELRPGDLVFFDTSGKNNGNISHVGIYAGNDLFLHADCTKGVTISSLSNAYYARNYVTGSRILSDRS